MRYLNQADAEQHQLTGSVGGNSAVRGAIRSAVLRRIHGLHQLRTDPVALPVRIRWSVIR